MFLKCTIESSCAIFPPLSSLCYTVDHFPILVSSRICVWNKVMWLPVETGHHWCIYSRLKVLWIHSGSEVSLFISAVTFLHNCLLKISRRLDFVLAELQTPCRHFILQFTHCGNEDAST